MPFAGRALQRSALNSSAIMNYGHAAPRAQGCEHGAGARLLQRMRFSDRPLFLLDIDDAAAFMMQPTTHANSISCNPVLAGGDGMHFDQLKRREFITLLGRARGRSRRAQEPNRRLKR